MGCKSLKCLSGCSDVEEVIDDTINNDCNAAFDTSFVMILQASIADCNETK